MKKQWISIKRGFIRDPKHRIAMGECVWLFQYMIDIADWDTGTIHVWKDEAASDDMQMPIRTLREQRRKLESLDYIICSQRQYGQEIKITNWTNPREYSGEVYNPRQGDRKPSPSENGQGDTQGYIQGDTQGSTQDVTPTYIPNNQIPVGKSHPKFSDKTTEHRRKMLLLAERIEAEISVKPDMSNRKWEKTVNEILKLEEAGQPFEQFAKWLKAGNDYNRPKSFQIADNPKLILTLWPQAFQKKSTIQTTELEDWQKGLKF